MNESTIFLPACLAVIALMAVLIYLSNCGRTAALKNIHRRVDQIMAGNRRIEHDLAQHRRVLNDGHKQIHAVSKGLEKPAR
jgi:hypothetical protein